MERPPDHHARWLGYFAHLHTHDALQDLILTFPGYGTTVTVGPTSWAAGAVSAPDVAP